LGNQPEYKSLALPSIVHYEGSNAALNAVLPIQSTHTRLL
jgi:hypothetical protein